MFGIAGTAELSTFCPGTGTWNRLQDGTKSGALYRIAYAQPDALARFAQWHALL